MFMSRQLYQKTWEFYKKMHTFYVNFKKAYNTIHRESLLNIIKEFHFPKKLINLISISDMETLMRVQVGNSIIDPISVKSG